MTAVMSSLPDSAPATEVASPNGTEYPLAAQIPLSNFTLPTFPREASRLRELTLTADIKLDEYQSLLSPQSSSGVHTSEPFNTSTLPQSITHLTLELFHLGFPAGFLFRLATALPNLKSLTLFSCLIDGVSDQSRRDADAFFQHLPLLKELHVIDTFARPGFWETMGKMFDKRVAEEGDGVKVVGVSYTYRGHEDEDFLARVNGEELAGLIGKGVVGISVGLVPPSDGEVGNGVENVDGKKGSGKPEGILPFAVDSRASQSLKARFEKLNGGELKDLKILDLCLWTLRAEDVGHVLKASGGCADGPSGLVHLTVSVLMEEGWFEKLVEKLKHSSGSQLEALEIVGVPAREMTINAGDDEKWNTATEKVFLTNNEVGSLGKASPKLGRLSMSISKATSMGHVDWNRDQNGKWEGVMTAETKDGMTSKIL